MIDASPARTWQLQAQPTPLLGRDRELETIQRLLQAEHVRLLTLTGPAGVGKTRLAIEAGSRMAGAFPDGVSFIDLSPVRDPGLVLPAIAQQLGIRDTGDRLVDRIPASLQDRRVLLILDNVEQVLPAGEYLAKLVAASPSVTWLVTSRVPLQLRWEHLLRIAPLAVPDRTALPALDELAQIPSVALFVERARRHRADFALTEREATLVAHLAAHLDGLPLAIELAAARMGVLPLAVIVYRLADRLQFLAWKAQDLPHRHRSLHAAIDWSYELLPRDEQRLFRHLGVFVGRISLAAISAVMGHHDEVTTLEALISLADQSLILPAQQGENGEPCFDILETVREYALDQLLQNGELETARTRHARYFLHLAEHADSQLRTRNQHCWLLRLEREHDNLRASLRRLSDYGEGELGLRLATALGYFREVRGYIGEGQRQLSEALAQAPEADPQLRARALSRLGGLLVWSNGEAQRATNVLTEALDLARSFHDTLTIAQSLTYLGFLGLQTKEWDQSKQFLVEAQDYWREAQHGWGIAYALLGLGTIEVMRGHYRESEWLLEESVTRFCDLGDELFRGLSLVALATALAGHGEISRAAALYHQLVELSDRAQDRRLLLMSAAGASWLLRERGDPEQIACLMGAADTLQRTSGIAEGMTFRMRVATTVESLQARLEPGALAAALTAGRSLSFEQMAAVLRQALDAAMRPILPEETARTLRQSGVLSFREQEVLRLVADGLSDKQIVRELAIAERTVRRHLSSTLNKLDAANRPQAVAIAVRRGLL